MIYLHRTGRLLHRDKNLFLEADVRNFNILLNCVPSGWRSQVRFARSPAATCSSRAADSVTGRVQDSVSDGGRLRLYKRRTWSSHLLCT